MNRINQLFQQKKQNILSVYFTAGYPQLTDTLPILTALQNAGVDMVEIGMPFSDPLADGPVIQDSSSKALKNGMSLKVLFEQLKEMRKTITMPVILMGYFNPVFQFGVEKFCKKCAEVGVDGLILPDLPMDEYKDIYKGFFEKNWLHNIFLMTPQTSEDRIREIDSISTGFIYMVSSFSTTGSGKGLDISQSYFERMSKMQLKNPKVIGFGIKDKSTFENACKYANGAIIGTAFVKALSEPGEIDEKVKKFIKQVR